MKRPIMTFKIINGELSLQIYEENIEAIINSKKDSEEEDESEDEENAPAAS